MVLVGLIVDVTYTTFRGIFFSKYNENEFLAYINAEAGFRAGISLLKIDRTDYDALTEYWAKEYPPYPLNNGYATFKIIDEQGKLNINKLVNELGEVDTQYEGIFVRLLSYLSINTNIVNAIIDWIDRDSDPLTDGAEEEYYQSKGYFFKPRNDYIPQIDELLLIKGISVKLLYGYNLPIPGKNTGLIDYITVFGDGKINVNTAPYYLLLSLSDNLDEVEISQIVEKRKDIAFKSINDFKIIGGIDDEVFESIKSILTVKTNIFCVIGIGRVGDIEKYVIGYVRRDGNTIKVLEYKKL
jgi:general secretion pathway protein K